MFSARIQLWMRVMRKLKSYINSVNSYSEGEGAGSLEAKGQRDVVKWFSSDRHIRGSY